MSTFDQASDATERGAQLLGIGRARDALAELARAVAVDPQNPRAHCLIAQAHLTLEEPDEALAAARRATALAPEDEWPHRLRALAALRLKAKPEARDAVLAAARLEPESQAVHLVLAQVLLKTDDPAGAIAAARHAVALGPEDSAAHDALGYVLLNLDEPRAAIDAFTRALTLDPQNAVAHNNLAVAQGRIRMGAGERIEGLERALRLDPTLAVARGNAIALGRGARGAGFAHNLAVIMAVLGALTFVGAVVRGDAATGVGTLGGVLAFALAFEVLSRLLLRRAPVPEATRRLVAHDRRARRFRPDRWNWRRATRVRPWWWIALSRVSPPKALVVNVVVLGASVAGGATGWAIAAALALPFTFARVIRWVRIRRPGSGSWQPPRS